MKSAGGVRVELVRRAQTKGDDELLVPASAKGGGATSCCPPPGAQDEAMGPPAVAVGIDGPVAGEPRQRALHEAVDPHRAWRRSALVHRSAPSAEREAVAAEWVRRRRRSSQKRVGVVGREWTVGSVERAGMFTAGQAHRSATGGGTPRGRGAPRAAAGREASSRRGPLGRVLGRLWAPPPDGDEASVSGALCCADQAGGEH